MLRVADIMSENVYTVDFAPSAEEAAWGLTRRKIGAAPEKSRQGQIVGMLTKADLVDPASQQWIKKEATVGDLMDPEVFAVYEDDAALVAVHELVSKNQERLIVLNTENALVGIVSDGHRARPRFRARRCDESARCGHALFPEWIGHSKKRDFAADVLSRNRPPKRP